MIPKIGEVYMLGPGYEGKVRARATDIWIERRIFCWPVQIAVRSSQRPRRFPGEAGQRKHFVELAVHEFHGDLDAVDAVLARKINRPLRVLKIVSVERIGRPIPKAAEVQLRAHVL